jgi:phytoene dehydrogenase-like protein
VKINLLLERLPRVRAAGVSPEEAFGGTFHIDEGYEQMRNSWNAAASGNVPDTPPGEVYCHTLTDPSILSAALQTAGWHTLTLFGLDLPYRLFANVDPAEHATRKQLVLQKYLAGLNRICEEPIEACLARAADGSPCVEIKSPVDLEQELDLDLGNIFHNQLSWFFGSDEADGALPAGTAPGQWGVETEHPRIFLCGSSAQRGGAVSGIPGYNAACCVLGPNVLPEV